MGSFHTFDEYLTGFLGVILVLLHKFYKYYNFL